VMHAFGACRKPACAFSVHGQWVETVLTAASKVEALHSERGDFAERYKGVEPVTLSLASSARRRSNEGADRRTGKLLCGDLSHPHGDPGSWILLAARTIEIRMRRDRRSHRCTGGFLQRQVLEEQRRDHPRHHPKRHSGPEKKGWWRSTHLPP